jgi:DNA gyrase subunit A
VDGVNPRVLTLREVISHYLEHQKEVVTRRTKYHLDKAERQAHVLEGYLIALDNLDEVIELIRAADDVESARNGLISRFGLSEIQAQAILEMRLRALTGLERKKVKDEHADLMELITELRAILSDEERLMALIREEPRARSTSSR